MPLAFIPSRSRQSGALHGRGHNRPVTHIRSRLATNGPFNMKNHLLVMIVTVSSCVVISAFLVYDLVQIYNFFSEWNAKLQDNITENGVKKTGNSTDTVPSPAIDTSVLLRNMQNYTRQRALGASLIVLLLFQAAAGISVYFGVEKKVRYMLAGYLVLTFPVMTFAMVYVIIFMVDTSSTFVYVKIVAVILVYTIQANLYRLVYRLYQMLKYESRRSQRNEGESNDAFNDDRRNTGQPVIIQLKPPPYEKEPPPYSLESPIPSVEQDTQQMTTSPVLTDTTSPTSRYSLSYGIGSINPSSSIYDFSPESVQALSPSSSSNQSTDNTRNDSSPSSNQNEGNSRLNSTISNQTEGSTAEPATPPYSVSVEPCTVYNIDVTSRDPNAPPPYSAS